MSTWAFFQGLSDTSVIFFESYPLHQTPLLVIWWIWLCGFIDLFNLHSCLSHPCNSRQLTIKDFSLATIVIYSILRMRDSKKGLSGLQKKHTNTTITNNRVWSPMKLGTIMLKVKKASKTWHPELGATREYPLESQMIILCPWLAKAITIEHKFGGSKRRSLSARKSMMHSRGALGEGWWWKKARKGKQGTEYSGGWVLTQPSHKVDGQISPCKGII